MASTIIDLEWVRDGVDAGESAAVQNLLYIAVVSREVASQIVDLHWVRDGLDEPEVRAIDWMSGLESVDVIHLVIALDWVRDGVDGAEAGAIRNLSVIANQDSQAGVSFVDLGWIRDGLDEIESRAIHLMAGIHSPGFALTMAGLDWVRDGIGEGEIEAVRYLSSVAGQNAALALSMTTLGWIRDGLDDLERDALDWVGNFTSAEVASSVIALPWMQDGIVHAETEAIEYLSYIANDDAPLGLSIIALDWMGDGIDSLENDALGWILNFSNPMVASSLVDFAWMQDGVEEEEIEVLEYLSYTSKLDAGAGLSLASLGWIVDGIEHIEPDAIENLYSIAYYSPETLKSLISLQWMGDDIDSLENDALGWIGNFRSPMVTSSVVALPWMQDGIDEEEVEAIELLSYIANDDASLGLSIATLGWMGDGIHSLENDALDWIINFSSPMVASSLVALPWMQDSLGRQEVETIEYLSYISNLGTGAAVALASLGWIADGIADVEANAIEYLYYIAYQDPEAMMSMVSLSWMRDGISDLEASAVERIGNIQNGEVISSVVALDWVGDGIAVAESQAIEQISYLSYDHPQETQLVLGMPFLEAIEPPDVSAISALSSLAAFKPEIFAIIMSHPGIRAGITDEMAPIVATLYGVGDENPGLIPILLNPNKTSIELRSILLPLSGEVVLAIIRTGPGAARSMDLLEESVRAIEEYMEFPLSTNYVGLLYEHAVVEGYAGANYGTHITILPEYDVDDGTYQADSAAGTIAHEVAHYYWGGNANWVDEGAANVMASLVAGDLIEHPIDATNLPCRHARSIAELELLATETDDAEFLCNYSLGERLFLDLNRSLGESRFRQNLRQLYVLSQVEDGANDYTGTSVSIGHVRQAFGSGSGPVDTVIARWYDGAGPFDLSGLGDEPVLRSLPGIDGRVDSAYVSLTPEGPAVSSFAIGELTDWAYLTIEFSYSLSGASREIPFEVVEFYEDGFVFRRTEAELVAESQYIGKTHWFTVGSPPGEWSTGHYTIHVYAGDRKIAEVQYEVTR